MPNPTPEEMRELDARVAVEVMGKTVRRGHEIGIVDYDHRNDLLINCEDEKEPRWGHCWELPRYTTDIAAAWSVVEKMRAMGYAWQACQTWDGPDNDPKSEPGGWSFMHKDDDKYEREGESQIRPSECPVALAISLAALAALSASNSMTKEG